MTLHQTSTRTGRYLKQATGYRAFVPAPLPPNPRLTFDDAFLDVLSRADRAIGRLDGCAETLPNSELFVFMYIRKEAVLSSQIEGTQASLMDVLEFEAATREAVPRDVSDVFNYVAAMDHGLARLKTLPLSLRLIREIHARLLSGVRGARDAGEFRDKQNWIGPAGSLLKNAIFVPPAPHDMHQALDRLEKFLHDKSRCRISYGRELHMLISKRFTPSWTGTGALADCSSRSCSVGKDSSESRCCICRFS